MRPGAVTHVTTIELPLSPETAFEVVTEELAIGLERANVSLPREAGGAVLHDGIEVGRVLVWDRGAQVALEWRAPEWQPDRASRLELRFEARSGSTAVTLEHRGWAGIAGDAVETAAWFAGEVLAPFLHAVTPATLGDWFTDRNARRPFGSRARATYGDPLYHYPNFRVLLEELALTPDDVLLEVGCGGGALLKEALRSGCRAAAIDHSHDMVRLAREANREAIEQGRLEIRYGDAGNLPFPDAAFTKAVMTGVLGFLTDPVGVFRGIRRVLRPGGLFVTLGSDPELKDTPAAPEPMASRLRFYGDEALADLGRAAGFDEVRVVRRDLGAYARDAGVPEEHLPLFEAAPARFLVARTKG